MQASGRLRGGRYLFWIRKLVNCTLDGLHFTRRRYRRCVTGAVGECQDRIFPGGFTAMGADSGPCRSHPVSVIPSVTIEDRKNIVAPARQILFTAQYFLSKTTTTTDKQQQQSSTCRRISGRENKHTYIEEATDNFSICNIYCFFESDIRETMRND